MPAIKIGPDLTGLAFAENGAANSDVRINFLGVNFLPRNTHTALCKIKYRAQLGFYATFWHCNNSGSFHATNDEFGCHPYPTTGSLEPGGGGQSNGGTSSSGDTQYYEIAGLGAHDYIANSDSGPIKILVPEVEVWHVRRTRIVGGNVEHSFVPDLYADPFFQLVQSVDIDDIDTPSDPVFVIGCSPWTSSNFASSGAGATNVENPYCRYIRHIQLFDEYLSLEDCYRELLDEYSAGAVTVAGQAGLFYSNKNPTPDNILDMSGNGHNPSWANANRPALWVP